MRLVDVDSRTEALPPFEVLPGVSHRDVSPDGRVAAFGGVDSGTQLYDLPTGAPIGDPFPSRSSINFGVHTADGRSMITFEDPPIVWDIDPASWREKACTVAGRNLTRREWQPYMPPDEEYRATCPGLAVVG